MRKIYLIGSLACLFAACKPSVNLTTPATAGDADFRSYLAIGNSLTAGYADGSLYVTGQLNSYPQRLHEQFRMVQDRGAQFDEFYQPLLHSDQGYPGPKKILDTVTSCAGVTSLSPVDFIGFSADAQDAAPYVSNGPNGEIDNIGVPGIRIADYPVAGYAALAAAVGNAPWAARFYHAPNTGTPLDELKYRVATQHPTFFTMWLGANDVLGFATSGGEGDGSGLAVPTGNFYNPNDITPNTVFYNNYDSAVAAAVATGAKGALINIPDVTSIPFFTTVPANGLYLSRQGQVDSLTAYYASTLHIVFKLGYNYFVVQDHMGNTRQAVPGELVLLTVPQDSLTCYGMGSLYPIPKKYVLTTEEIQQVRNATTAFNNHISGAAAVNNLALVDMNSYLGTISSGIVYNGVKYNAQYVTGGAFSLDGVHLTPRGYALVANHIIEAVNAKYHSTVHTVDVNQYHGILFPF